nr:MAG TPA: hypothetical protein [Caudoviricetes sp.]
MTELYIDGYPVSLGEDFLIDFYSKNPFFTKDGEFTYDIDIDLRDPSNERIYKHIQRTHNGIRPTGRSATFITDGRVITRGTEIILSMEEFVAKIQVVSGNSELNYLSGGDKKMRDLDLGSIENLTEETALASLYGKYPEWNFVCTPVTKNPLVESQFMESSFMTGPKSKTFNAIDRNSLNGIKYYDDTKFIAQPYLMYYIDKVCEKLGYVIIENYLLNDPRNTELIAVNGIETLDFNRMIPNWEIDKFFTEVEKFFNVTFLVSQKDKTIKIQHIYEYYKNNDIVEISKEKLIGSVDKKYDVEDNLDLLYKNVKYTFPSSVWYNTASFSKELRESCTISLRKNFEAIKEYVASLGEMLYNYLLIMETVDNGNRYIIKRFNRNLTTSEMNYMYYLAPVDFLRGIEKDTSEKGTTLDIMPAEIAVLNLSGHLDDNSTTYVYYSTIPFCRNAPSTGTDEDETKEEDEDKKRRENGLNEYISNGIPEDYDPDKIFVAFYKGIRNCLSNPEGNAGTILEKIHYPMCLVYPYVVATPVQLALFYNFLYKPGNDDDNLSLAYRYNNLYCKNMKIDTSTEYTIRFFTNKIYDSKSIFIIDNKKFYCKELHYTIEPEGLNQIVEGTFYAM